MPSHRNTNSVFRLGCPTYNINTYVVKVDVFTQSHNRLNMNRIPYFVLCSTYSTCRVMMVCLPPRDASPHQDSAGTAPISTPPPSPAAPATTDTGNTVPQSHSASTPLKRPMLTLKRGAQARGQRLGKWTLQFTFTETKKQSPNTGARANTTLHK